MQDCIADGRGDNYEEEEELASEAEPRPAQEEEGGHGDGDAASAGRDGEEERPTTIRKTTGERDSDAEQGDAGEVDDSWMRPELDISRMKPGSFVEVRSEEEWWECNIVEINEDKNEVLVHYVGGTEDEDEWVEVQPEKIQLAPLIEVVWAKVKDGAPWPALVIEGTLRNSYCKKLKVFHLLHMATYHVLRNATTAMTAASIPAKITDEKLQHAINISKRAMQFGKLPESVLSTIEASYKQSAPSAARRTSHPKSSTQSPTGRGRGSKRSASAAAAPEVGGATTARQARRKQAMSKLGLIPPLS